MFKYKMLKLLIILSFISILFAFRLNTNNIPDGQYSVVSIIGPARVGKSYLSNKLAHQYDGIKKSSVSSGIQSHTKDVIIIPCRSNLLVIDTEGNDVSADTNKMNLWSMAVSDIVIYYVYNTFSKYDRDNIKILIKQVESMNKSPKLLILLRTELLPTISTAKYFNKMGIKLGLKIHGEIIKSGNAALQKVLPILSNIIYYAATRDISTIRKHMWNMKHKIENDESITSLSSYEQYLINECYNNYPNLNKCSHKKTLRKLNKKKSKEDKQKRINDCWNNYPDWESCKDKSTQNKIIDMLRQKQDERDGLDTILKIGSILIPLIALSDRNLKTNIIKINEYNELNVYKWDWNIFGKLLGGTMNRGFIYQEVYKKYPECTTWFIVGMVDYTCVSTK